MNPEMKLDLISKIAQSNDSLLLEEIKKLLELTDSDKIYQLSDSQLESLKAAENDIKYGNVIDHEEVKTMTSEWLKK